ncbi:hypothetical protein ETB97_005489 [Aspergillus alliaceus]|uniref:Uncharacterized protein n=1 Tax=Petromyces alliaceus TaxID=209559 RepID=A0A5N7BUP2_PETAA|nr:hypothetical protein BDV23DRAFT_188151 [Aspergillus alliaceus]KAF5857635.1 hypothetical protein ETB97_005489 [Aspergillus burnettii]
MQIILALTAMLLAPIISAAPMADNAVDKRQLTNALLPEGHDKYVEQDQGNGLLGNLGSTLMIGFDHAKYTVDPPSAAQPFKPAESSPGREAHRKAHLAIYEGMKNN